jgi:hypothetical protein
VSDIEPISDSRTLLSGLLLLADDKSATWSPAELASLWRHQLAAPLLVDLGTVEPDAAMTISQATATDLRKLESFVDLLDHPSPPIELLQLAKSFAKSRRSAGPDAGFPAEIATGLYYLSIALALTRLGRRISEMEDAKLKQGFEWAVRQPWLDSKSKEVLESGMTSIAEGRV